MSFYYEMMRKHKNNLPTVLEKIDLGSDARLFVAGMINEQARKAKQNNKKSSADLVKFNIGYCLGYLSQEKARFWTESTGIVHPYFGTKSPKPVEAFNAGFKTMELHQAGVDSMAAAEMIRKLFEEGLLDYEPNLTKVG